MYNPTEMRSLFGELIECASDWSAQYGCSCGHPACKSCNRRLETADLLARARMAVRRKPMVVGLINHIPRIIGFNAATLPSLNRGTEWAKSTEEKVLYWKPFQHKQGRYGAGSETEGQVRLRHPEGVLSFTEETILLCEKGNVAVGIRYSRGRHDISVMYSIDSGGVFRVEQGFRVKIEDVGMLRGRLLAMRYYNGFCKGATKVILEKHCLGSEEL